MLWNWNECTSIKTKDLLNLTVSLISTFSRSLSRSPKCTYLAVFHYTSEFRGSGNLNCLRCFRQSGFKSSVYLNSFLVFWWQMGLVLGLAKPKHKERYLTHPMSYKMTAITADPYILCTVQTLQCIQLFVLYCLRTSCKGLVPFCLSNALMYNFFVLMWLVLTLSAVVDVLKFSVSLCLFHFLFMGQKETKIWSPWCTFHLLQNLQNHCAFCITDTFAISVYHITCMLGHFSVGALKKSLKINWMRKDRNRNTEAVGLVKPFVVLDPAWACLSNCRLILHDGFPQWIA